jgi:putative endonuclease
VRRYELDLVALRGAVVVFVEVKTRARGPQEAVDALSTGQRRRIRRAAESWIHAHPGVGEEFRFDLISVDIRAGDVPTVRQIEDAFYGEDVL